jgi:hypothetical protein
MREIRKSGLMRAGASGKLAPPLLYLFSHFESMMVEFTLNARDETGICASPVIAEKITKTGRDGRSARRGYRVRAEFARSTCAANEDCTQQRELDTPRACHLRDLRAFFEGELTDD